MVLLRLQVHIAQCCVMDYSHCFFFTNVNAISQSANSPLDFAYFNFDITCKGKVSLSLSPSTSMDCTVLRVPFSPSASVHLVSGLYLTEQGQCVGDVKLIVQRCLSLVSMLCFMLASMVIVLLGRNLFLFGDICRCLWSRTTMSLTQYFFTTVFSKLDVTVLCFSIR